MENLSANSRQVEFHRLKLTKKQHLTKSIFALEFEIPADLLSKYSFKAGQYVTLKFCWNGIEVQKDFSMTSAPFEKKISLGIKITENNNAVRFLVEHLEIGILVEISTPRGRFTISSKPHEFRTIIGFAGGIGITPILSHFKNLLHTEPRTRLFLFYGNRTPSDVAFQTELQDLQEKYPDRLQIYHFFSREKIGNGIYEGRLDEKKVALIINQFLLLDDTDEESTIWDAVDEVLICGKGEMIKSIANACYKHGIPKKNIHFELFEEFNEDIYPVEKEFPFLENIEVNFKLLGENHQTVLANNKMRLLQQLLIQKYPVPYSCKSGI